MEEELIKLSNGLYKNKYSNYLYMLDMHCDYVTVKSPVDGSELKATEHNNVYLSSNNEVQYYVPNQEKVLPLIDKEGNNLEVVMTKMVDGEETISILRNGELKEYKLYDLEEDLLELVKPNVEEEVKLEAVDTDTFVDLEGGEYTNVDGEIIETVNSEVALEKEVELEEPALDNSDTNDISPQIDEVNFETYRGLLSTLDKSKVEGSSIVSMFTLNDEQSVYNHRVVQIQDGIPNVLIEKNFSNDDNFMNHLLIPVVEEFATSNEIELNEMEASKENDLYNYHAGSQSNNVLSIKNIDESFAAELTHSVSLVQNSNTNNYKTLSDYEESAGKQYVIVGNEDAFSNSLFMITVVSTLLVISVFIGMFLAK